MSLGFVRRHRVPIAKLLVELLHVFLALPLLVLSHPPILQNGSIVVDCTAIVVDAMLLRGGSDGSCAWRVGRYSWHERLLDGGAGLLGLRALDVVWVVKLRSGCFL